MCTNYLAQNIPNLQSAINCSKLMVLRPCTIGVLIVSNRHCIRVYTSTITNKIVYILVLYLEIQIFIKKFSITITSFSKWQRHQQYLKMTITRDTKLLSLKTNIVNLIVVLCWRKLKEILIVNSSRQSNSDVLQLLINNL